MTEPPAAVADDANHSNGQPASTKSSDRDHEWRLEEYKALRAEILGNQVGQTNLVIWGGGGLMTALGFVLGGEKTPPLAEYRYMLVVHSLRVARSKSKIDLLLKAKETLRRAHAFRAHARWYQEEGLPPHEGETLVASERRSQVEEFAGKIQGADGPRYSRRIRNGSKPELFRRFAKSKQRVTSAVGVR